VGTAKRERQKANRQQRLEELARQSRRDSTKKRVFTIGGAIIGGLVLLFGLAWIVRDDEDTATPPVTDVATTVATTEAGPTTTVDPEATTTTVDPDAATTTVAPSTTVATEFAYGTGECPDEDGSSEKPDTFTDAPQLCIDPSGNFVAEVVTNKGDFTITLDAATAPGNVNNFVTLARWGYYDGTGCHRVLSEFVVQCGRPGDDEEAPGYTVPDELPAQGAYEEGMVAMANTGSPNSGGGQWFIITGPDGAALPPQYTIIGRVTAGYDSTVAALEGLADPLADNGVPPLVPIDIESVTITKA
jgi:cyclophilin family peptidyl-prolyl cis-trans isomerase